MSRQQLAVCMNSRFERGVVYDCTASRLLQIYKIKPIEYCSHVRAAAVALASSAHFE
jgi:hypothetical protein